MLLVLGRVIDELRQGRWRLESTLDAMPDALVELDAERRLRQVRAQHREQLPLSGEAPAGLPLSDLLPEGSRAPVTALLDHAREDGTSPRIRLPVDGAGGRRFFELTAATHASVSGEGPRGYVLVSRDVTELERAERELRDRNDLLQHLVALSPIGILLTDLDSGRVCEANPALLSQCGLGPEQLAGLCLVDLFAERSAHDRVMERLQTSGRCDPVELDWRRADGALQSVRLSALVASDPQGKRLVWTLVEDVSEQRRIERAKGELVAVVSHELRTPLTALMGAVGLLAGTAGDGLDPQSRKLLHVALDNGQRLRQLIDDLLDLDRMVAGRLRFTMEVRRLKPLLLNVLSSNQTYGADRSVRLELLDPLPDVEVRVDGQRLIQVLGNLVSNAIKFSPQGAVVELSAEEVDARVVIAVRDHGPGVPVEFRDRMFERFSQADASSTRTQGGSGLGLAISRELVEHMGGSIDYQSTADGGACFRVLLPRA
nr:ATP-binding protein [Lysobacter sp. CAU 1642]